MKKLIYTLICLAASLAMLSACGQSEKSQDDKISIVVTAFPHYDFARQLTKDVENVNIKMLISPGTEVHSYEPSPSDILAISDCDLFICTGGESEGWTKNILSSTKNDTRRVISFMEICSPDGCHESTEHEHEHEHEYDEHVWTLPLFCQGICEHIFRELCRLDEKNTDKYNANLERLLSQFSELDSEFSDIFSSKKRDYIIVADRFPFYHLATYYKLKYEAAYPGCSSSTEPSALVIAELSQKVKDDNIPYVFTTEFSNKKIAGSVVEGTDTSVLTLHSCHNVTKEDFESGITYFDLMRQNAVNLRKALCE